MHIEANKKTVYEFSIVKYKSHLTKDYCENMIQIWRLLTCEFSIFCKSSSASVTGSCLTTYGQKKIGRCARASTKTQNPQPKPHPLYFASISPLPATTNPAPLPIPQKRFPEEGFSFSTIKPLGDCKSASSSFLFATPTNMTCPSSTPPKFSPSKDNYENSKIRLDFTIFRKRQPSNLLSATRST